MGRYITLNSQFNPFSFDDYIKPYQIYGEAYKEMENQYDDLSSKATILENLANSAIDQREYQQYKSFADDLRGQANQLATQGLSPSLRRELMTMRNRYKQDISPIEDLYKKREELIKEQRDALMRDNSLLFSNTYSDMSLNDFRNTQNQTYTPLSRDKVTNDTAALVKAYAQSIVGEPDLSPIFDNQYVQSKISQGIPLEQILLAAQRDENAPEGLKKIINTIKNSVNYDNWGNNQGLIDEAINKGLMSGIESVKSDIKNNPNYVSPFEWTKFNETQRQFNERLAEEQRQFNLSQYGVPGADGKYYKSLGAGKMLITELDKNGNPKSTNIIGVPDNDNSNENPLRFVRSNTDMRKLGYEPLGAVLKANGEWQFKKSGEDIGVRHPWAPVFMGATRSELSDWSGDVRYSNWSNEVNPSIIIEPEDLPKFLEDKLMEIGNEYGVNPFMTDAFQIMKVPSRGRHKDGDSEPDDYIIYVKKPKK